MCVVRINKKNLPRRFWQSSYELISSVSEFFSLSWQADFLQLRYLESTPRCNTHYSRVQYQPTVVFRMTK